LPLAGFSFDALRSTFRRIEEIPSLDLSRESGMKARVKWIENVSFVAESGSGHALVLDGAPEAGGRTLVCADGAAAAGLGGCSPSTSFTSCAAAANR